MAENPTTAYITAHAAEIGKLVICVSLFDDDLSDLLAECFCLTAFQENALLRPLNTRTKLETLNRLAKLFMEKDGQRRIAAWCNTAKDRLDDRNELVHGQPRMENDHPTFRLYSGSKALLGQPESWPIERVCDLRDYFIDVISELRDQIRPEFATWIEQARNAVRSEHASEQTPPPR